MQEGHLAEGALHVASVVDLAYINQLLSSGSGNIFRVLLFQQRLDGRFDDVHRISGAGDFGCEIGNAGAFAHFPDVLLASEAEACHLC
jgi:hypothetical protein